MQYKLNYEIDKNHFIDKSSKFSIENIEKLEWKIGAHSLQSWGSTIHRIAPYVGRIKPSFAHFLINHSTKIGDTILDPFCGIGTIPTEAALMGRKSIGIDLNPYAVCIAKAKVDNKRKLEDLIRYIEKLNINTSRIKLDKIPAWVKEYYNEDTLKEILATLKILKKDKQYFLEGCLVGISQGHRPGHLSKPCAWTLPYKPRPDDPGEYRALKPRLIEKVKRTYKKDFSHMENMSIHLADSSSLHLKEESIDHIISSPPYYNTLDYVGSHRLRLAIMGIYDEKKKKKLAAKLIQDYDTYLERMSIVFDELYRVLKYNGYCILIVGDHFRGKTIINTSTELKNILIKKGFKFYGVIEDKIPPNKSVQKTTTNEKSERILILRKE